MVCVRTSEGFHTGVQRSDLDACRLPGLIPGKVTSPCDISKTTESNDEYAGGGAEILYTSNVGVHHDPVTVTCPAGQMALVIEGVELFLVLLSHARRLDVRNMARQVCRLNR